MKILMILESEFPPDVRVENEIQALIETGHEVHLACTTKKHRQQNERSGNLTIHRKTMSPFIYKSSVGCLKFPFYFNFWRKFIFNICANERFDAIHIHDLPLSKIGTEIKKRFNIPLIIDLHENWPALLKTAVHTQTIAGKLLSSNRQWIKYEKKMLSKADLVITIIEEARDRITALGIDPGKICIVSNTLNIKNISIEIKTRTENIFSIFYGGGINRHRGIQVVIHALKLLSDKNIFVRFIIVGDGSFKQELENLANMLGVSSNLVFTGHKPFHEMLEILAGSDMAIIPHLRTDNNDASSPNKLYQYMYLNKPILSSDCTSLKRIINGVKAGFIYRSDSPEDLASLLEKLYYTRSLLDEIHGNGKKAVMEKYNWNIDKERLINGYRKLPF